MNKERITIPIDEVMGLLRTVYGAGEGNLDFFFNYRFATIAGNAILLDQFMPEYTRVVSLLEFSASVKSRRPKLSYVCADLSSIILEPKLLPTPGGDK